MALEDELKKINEIALKYMRYSYPEFVDENKELSGFDLFKKKSNESGALDDIRAMLIDLANETKADLKSRTPENPTSFDESIFRSLVKLNLLALIQNQNNELPIVDRLKRWWRCWRAGVTTREAELVEMYLMIDLVNELKIGA